jgi:predicted NBD/HSP70 family sugar kinase
MYLGIDVGATKTLFAVFDRDGQIVCEKKIKTSHEFQQFKADIAACISEFLKQFEISYCCCAVPGWIDYDKGVAVGFGNLPWQDVPMVQELQSLAPDVKILLHNDAKLAGLSEAILLHKKYRKVLYITISSGIGGGVIINDVIDKDFENFEPGQMIFEKAGKTEKWETYASGQALHERYGKMASEINDPAIWQEYVKDLVIGFEDLLATIQPDVVVVGGGVGAHFEKFQPYLQEELNKINNRLVPTPPLLKAKRPEEAVIYGCYDFIRQNL